MASASERHPHVPAMRVLHSSVFATRWRARCPNGPVGAAPAVLGVEGLVFGSLANFCVEITVQRCGGKALTFICCAVLLQCCLDFLLT